LYNSNDLAGLEEVDRVYVPIEKYNNLINVKNQEIIPYVKTITLNNDFSKYNFDKVLIGNIAHIKEFEGKEIYADNSLNVFNSYTCEYLKLLGVKCINLSFELNLEQLKEIKTDLESEVTVYGYLPLMISEHCVIGSEVAKCINCGLCEKDDYYLQDRTNRTFRILTDRQNCRNIILNAKKIFAPEVVEELNNIEYFRAYFLDETPDERREIVKLIKAGKKTSCVGYTAGHFYRGV
jgi:putative protease